MIWLVPSVLACSLEPWTKVFHPTCPIQKPLPQPIPTTVSERFNFASFDCGALILANNPEAKSATSILMKSKDQYLLNLCSANKFIEIELCEEVLVDTLVLANLEFFSSVFKKFTIYTSSSYPPQQWQKMGAFTAKNVRTLQTFAIPPPFAWAKYLRIAFETHYGNEYYCPLTVLKVYGTSMMEDVKLELNPKETKDVITISPSPIPSSVLVNETTKIEPTPVVNEPSKQDSVFKNILKRLQSLEKNATFTQEFLQTQIKEISGTLEHSIQSYETNMTVSYTLWNETLNQQVIIFI